MAKFVVEFSPPEKIKFEPNDVIESVINYRMILAPFQKQTQIEFNNVKLKEISVRFLTFINPLDKLKQFILTPPGDGFCFDVYKCTLEPKSQYELAITWQPSDYGNVRKLIKIEEVDSNRKYDFVILGNCNGSSCKQFKDDSLTHSKSNNTYLVNKQFIYDKKNISPIKKKCMDYKTERIILVENPEKIPETSSTNTLQSIRRETFFVKEKENVPIIKKNIIGRDTILTSPERSIKRPYKTCQDHVFNNHFSFKSLNKSSSPMSDDSLEKPLVELNVNRPQLDDFCLTPLKSTENLFSHIDVQKSNSFYDQLSIDITDGSFASSSFKLEDSLATGVAYIAEKRTPSEVSMHFCSNCIETPENELSNANMNLVLDTITVTLSGTKPKRPLFTIKNSYYKCSSTLPTMSKNKLKQYSNLSPQTKRIISAPKLDKYDEYLKSLTNPDILYNNNAKDPFLNMSQYYETEWLNRQESDMIRWLNALLTPTDKLVDEEQSGDLEQAAMAWVEVSKTSHKNKPMQLAAQKDLFAAQIYRQSPQQWSALRKATTNLIISTNVSSVLSKLTVSIEKDLITVRDDRQIHLDLSLKRKIIDLFKCYNSLWFRIGLEAIYGQIVHLKSGSDLDGVGWFVRKNLLSNDYVKKKFTKTTVLQVNLPSYNIAMKKFILRKILMLIFFLDRAKDQQLIRHNPCLFQTNSPHKSSYDLLMAFCADTVTAHGDIVRRLRSIGYNLTHKQTHLDEVNYAVKSLNDLRDGTRITRVVEILFKGNPLSQKLRLPAISKLQKIHNVNLAFTRIAQHISIEGNITTRDVVNGHREKILSLFWQIIYKFLTPRYNTAATKIQNWWRNSSLKLVILKRIRAKQIAKRHLAATKIQAYIRGHLIRKQWPVKQRDLIKNREILHLASTKIKHYLRDKLKHLTNERKQFIILRRTVVFVQRKFRTKLAMLIERQKYLKAKQSAVIIQKIFRGFLLRKNWSRIKNVISAEKTNQIFAIGIIKRALRRNLPPTRDHLEFLKLKHTVLYIQRQYMANRLMKLHQKYFITLKKTTITIQQRFRSKIAQRHYLKIKQSILIIQKVFRGFLVRKHWIEIQNHLILEKKNRINAINIVKRALRRNLPPTRDHLEFLKLKHTVLYIQRQYMANRLMKLHQKYFITLKKTTITIQQRFRSKIAQRHYLKIKQSILIIQKVFRGFLVRKHWIEIQNHLILEKKNRINAINIVKRALRRNLPPTRDHLEFLKLKHTVLYIQRQYMANRLMKLHQKYFITLKKTTIIIQQRFRSKIAQRHHLKIKQSILIIQKVFRGFLVRKHWIEIQNHLILEKKNRINAINIVKRALRRNLPPTRDHLEFLKLKHTVLYIQRQYMANRLMKLHQKYFITLKKTTIIIQQRFRSKIAQRHYLKIKQSILIIQKVFRGFLVRKHWIEIQNHLILEKKNRINAINIVKRALRRNLPPTRGHLEFLKLKHTVLYIQRQYMANRLMKLHQKYFITLKKTTITIQQRFRSKIAQRHYLKIKQSILIIQKVFRGFLVRKHWIEIQNHLILEKKKRINAINIMKRTLRRNLPETSDRTYFVRLINVVLFVQQVWKANLMMKKQRECYLKSRFTIMFIQRKFRAKIAMRTNRQNYLKVKQSVIMIQKVYRGFYVRKNWSIVKNHLTVTKARRVHSANVIKHILRKNLPATLDRIYYEKLRYSVQVVQRRFRANVTMRQQLEEFRKLKKSVIVIQQKFRAQQIMRIERERYVIFKTCTIRLQSSVRGYLARKKWPILHKQLCDNQKRLVRYANLIKKTLRKCLSPTEERIRFLELRRSVVVIQQRFRANASARRQRTTFIRTKAAVVVLQAYIRGYLIRRQWSKIKDELQAHQNQLVAASNTIKRFLRRCLPYRTERSKFLRLRPIAILIQTQYRTIVSSRILRTKYLQMVQSEMTLRRQNKELCVVQATVILQAHIRGYLARRQWPLIKERLKTEHKLTINLLDKNKAVCIIQRAFRRYIIRKKLLNLNNQLQLKKQLQAATLVQAHWRGYCVRKRYQCQQEPVKIPTKKTLTLGRRHNDVVNVINKQERNAYYVYIELSKVFWNLDTCTSLSKELCIKTIEGNIIDYIFRFLQYSNQSQPSIEAREPAIRVLTNLLRYHETSQLIWTKTVNTNIVKELIKMMKTSCGKFGATYKLYCSIATWIWIALQDPLKKQYIISIPNAVKEFKFMMNTLKRRYKIHKLDKKVMVLPSLRPTWFIGSKCQKGFESDFYATVQICQMLNITK